MSSGRSSSEAIRPGLRDRLTRALVLAAAAAFLASLLGPGLGPLVAPEAARAQAIPPPPPNPGETPVRPQTARPKPAPRLSTCPRCGYRCDPAWHYCVACGWDMTRLVGAAEEQQLEQVARATVRLVVGGRRNRLATAIPFGGAGLMLTNARWLVGADETRLRILTYNNQETTASIVGYDLPSGVGIIRAAVPGAPLLERAPATPAPPDSVWAVCYPVAFEGDVVRYLPVSLHRGHVTATGQTGTSYVTYENLLRTDHSIEDGCTGGALVDARGRIAGMVLGSRDDGLTYALPFEGLDPIVASLERNERPVRPYFGLGLVTPDDRRRNKFGIEPGSTQPLVAYLIPGSPAQKAGVHPGDTLLTVGGQAVATVREAGVSLLAAAPGGAGVPLTLRRAGAEVQVTVPPTPRPDRVMLEPFDELEETLEATLKASDGKSGTPAGLVLSDVVRGGRGEKNSYHNGDVLLSVNDKSIRNAGTYNEYIRTNFKDFFSDKPPADKRFASSYLVKLTVRTGENEKRTRDYVNLFPDTLAPPVY